VPFASSPQVQAGEVNMKHTALIAMILAILAASCAQAPAATPSVALPKTTPRIETPTPIATDAPTASYTPTTNPTAPPTATATRIPPTATPKPTDSPRPTQVIFQRDFNNGLLDVVKAAADHWNVLHEDGTKVEVIPDPTNSLDNDGKPREKVMKVTIHGDPVQHPDWAGSKQWWRVGDPDWTYGYPVKLVRAPSGIQVDANYDAGFADGHAGLLTANQSKDDGFKEGQYLLNDNFVVFEYQQ
jgi:hypothetical protein